MQWPCAAQGQLPVIVSRSSLPPGVVKSKSSVVRLEAVVKLPMTRLPMDPTPPGAISDGAELDDHAALDRAAAHAAGQRAAAEGDGAAAGGRADGAVGGHQRAVVDGRAAGVGAAAGEGSVPEPLRANDTCPEPFWMRPLKVVDPVGARVRVTAPADAAGDGAAAAGRIGQRVDGLRGAVQVEGGAAGKLHRRVGGQSAAEVQAPGSGTLSGSGPRRARC